ncbi:C1 family peptidase [Bdellovibrio reynosensis]|uniref:C1 family peptidase n=1 Tax=Bdellovibrio reynosensis TaxID=2835041 RepID=A0ABY4CE18_9BACT|nr:C1 family peptidase [Bdellovibrio reynosensis]UOF01991.1 C1 family peptidase [Bdellovibrio reynosensis]
MRNYIKPVGATLALSMILHVSPNFALASAENPGLREMTAEENQKLHKTKIKKVRPNRLGLERVNKERQSRGEAPISEDTNLPEVETEDSLGASAKKGGNTQEPILSATAVTTPAQVDNSNHPAFPPIGNQGSIGSCVAWATTYYMMSHEVCLTLGCNNKNYAQRIYSPKWTYNMINGGVDNGSYFSDAFSVLEKHGAATQTDFPYDSDYRAWDMNSEHWKRAINSRMKAASYATINTDAGMATVKQLLANGHVVVVGTYINSWQYRTVQVRPGVSSPFAGQWIATHMNGKVSGHAMTIVGYDDNIWTDINGNGAVEAAELGAFKFANSFGNTWRNAGYAWASYDAFRVSTTVPNFYPSGRIQLTQSGNATYSTYTSYTPKLIAEVRMSHALRSQISLAFGQSSTSGTSPSSQWTPFAFVGRGGGYAFNGTTSEVEGSFFFDISSLAASDVNTQKFYLISKDSTSGAVLTTRAFNVVNPSVGNTLMAAAGVPMTTDATTKTLVASAAAAPAPAPAPAPTPTPTPVPSDTTAPTMPGSFNIAPALYNNGLNAKVTLTWTASSDNVGVAKYRIFVNGSVFAETTSLNYVHMNITKNVTYNYQVAAVDAAGNVSAKTAIKSITWR